MILCCGEALIDMIPAPTTAGRDGFVPHSGGAVFNTAIALGRVGQSVGMVTGLSRDMFGRQLAATLAESRVDTTRAILSDRPTTLAFVQITNGNARYSFYDENTAGRMIVPADLPTLTDADSALFLGGISLAVEPCADTYAALATREAPSRVLMLDPNVRPGFIRDETRYRQRMDALLRLADIVKVSEEDLTWLSPDPPTLHDRLAPLRAAGPKLILLTRGGQGATAYLPDGTEVTAPARPVQVTDTVGAGDTFNAGILASLSEQGVLTKAGIAALDPAQVTRALDLATRMAAITVSRAGANPPWQHELGQPT